MAASDVQLKHAADGTLVVVGSGWPRGQDLVVSLGQQRFTVRVDTTGDFEVATGLTSYEGDLAIQHADAAPPTVDPVPHPLAVLFAQAVGQGFVLLTFLGGAAMGVAGVVRLRRYPRP